MNRIQEMDERISGVEDLTEKRDSLVNENVKSKNFLTQHIQETLNTMKTIKTKNNRNRRIPAQKPSKHV